MTKILLFKIFGVVFLSAVVLFIGLKDYQNWLNFYSQIANLEKAVNINLYSQSLKIKPLSYVLFTGDVMLDRGVEYQIKKHKDWFYPFSKIKPFLKESEMVVGNLEGPIVANPPQFPDHSLRFAFSSKVAKSLALANFKVLSLANNHTDNMGEKGYQETVKYLQKEGIEAVGHPIRCDKKAYILKESFVLLAINKTFPINCSNKKIVEIIKKIRQKYPDKFIVVIFHWGVEYSSKSTTGQQELAHKVIDAGADLVIGSHPHIVQEIEEYKGRLIFYSLGNFVFDQYFSQKTQEGLVVGLKLYPKKVVYQLFPTKSNLSQPFLIPEKERLKFLKNLAKLSSPNLSPAIQTGTIELKLSPFPF